MTNAAPEHSGFRLAAAVYSLHYSLINWPYLRLSINAIGDDAAVISDFVLP